MPIVLGIVIAVALHPLHLRLRAALAGTEEGRGDALVVLCLAALLTPTLLLLRVSRGRGPHGDVPDSGGLDHDPAGPGEGRRDGRSSESRIYETWNLASTNLGASDRAHAAPVEGGQAFGVVSLAKQGVVAAALAAHRPRDRRGRFGVQREPALATAVALGRRIGGERGAALVPLAGRAIATVAKGVVGVAAIQAMLAAVGLVAAGVPGRASGPCWS